MRLLRLFLVLSKSSTLMLDAMPLLWLFPELCKSTTFALDAMSLLRLIAYSSQSIASASTFLYIEKLNLQEKPLKLRKDNPFLQNTY